MGDQARGERCVVAYAAVRPVDAPGALADTLTRLVDRAANAHPSTHPADEEFCAHLARHASPSELEALVVDDLWLAFAAARGDDAALRSFESSVWPEAKAAISRVLKSVSEAEDAAQRLLEKLFVSDPPKALEFGGRAPLRGWLRVVATRDALSFTRRRSLEAVTSDREHLFEVASADPELEHMKRRFEPVFRTAFAAAFAEGDAYERSLLVGYFVDRLSMDQLAVVHGVHRITAFRRLDRARRALAERCRAQLRTGLDVSTDELDSLMRLVDSEFASLQQLLVVAAPPAGPAKRR